MTSYFVSQVVYSMCRSCQGTSMDSDMYIIIGPTKNPVFHEILSSVNPEDSRSTQGKSETAREHFASHW